MAVAGVATGIIPVGLDLADVDLNTTIRDNLREKLPIIADFIQTELIFLAEIVTVIIFIGLAVSLFYLARPRQTEAASDEALSLGG